MTAHDLRPRELAVVTSLSALTLLMGVAPHGILSATEPAALAWVKRAAGGFPEHPSAFASGPTGKFPDPAAVALVGDARTSEPPRHSER